MNKIRRRDVEQKPLIVVEENGDDCSTHSHSDIDSIHADEESKAHHGHRICWFLRLMGVLSILCAMTTYLAMELWLRPEDYNYVTNINTQKLDRAIDNNFWNDLQCPILDSTHAAHDVFQERDKFVGQKLQSSTPLPDWNNQTYDKVKSALYPWKMSHVVPYLQNGSSVYVSGTGTGVALYMTVDTVHQETNISGLTLFGNDWHLDNVVTTTKLLETAPGYLSPSTICQADSTNLSHVPSDAFDMVYTGSLQPLLDPLDLGTDQRDANSKYSQLCEAVRNNHDDESDSSSTFWMAHELHQIMQQRQADWLGRWVNEMVRIAKPGAPIVVENVQIGESVCNIGGGVVQSFWKTHASENTYNWNVDLASVIWEIDPIVTFRYNVVMRKRSES
ncbi:hypothetical protein IV203_011802 [Nitzschia inconspicua]|uniref:Uncharacterized protein n=1 Tax=Nitzschia inconspicua TaxID=303405 RepID=A0A9K3KSS0_9STRA|nr:hypothetical protein IV203_011802 [Nitzschia inconspicua]